MRLERWLTPGRMRGRPSPGVLFDPRRLKLATRPTSEAKIRALAASSPVDARTTLCRSLGRYKMFVDSADRGLSPHLVLDGYWEMWVTETMVRYLRPGMAVADVGANVGYFTLLMADLVGRTGRVHAFEPNPPIAALLRQNLAVNGFSAQVHPEPLSDCDDALVQLIVPENEPKNAYIVPCSNCSPDAQVDPLILRTRRLDSLADVGPLDFVKIDADAAEEAIWRGMEGLLVGARAMTVILEFAPARYIDPRGFLTAIAGQGFALVLIDPPDRRATGHSRHDLGGLARDRPHAPASPMIAPSRGRRKERDSLRPENTGPVSTQAQLSRILRSKHKREPLGDHMKSVDMATEEDVFACYRLFLGREPESSHAVRGHLSHGTTRWALIERVYRSPEAQRFRINAACGQMDADQDARNVEVIADPESTKRLTAHVEEVWSRYGREEAYYSVLANAKYLSDQLNSQGLEEFYETGHLEVQHFETVLKRNCVIPDANWTVLELGCGVGRMAEAFALRFQRYIGIDISSQHIELAQQRMASKTDGNTLFQILPEFILTPPNYDVFYSLIALQHNPPPLIAHLLDHALTFLSPGGYAYFQVPSFLYDYSFSLDDYLGGRGQLDVMEIHPLPQQYIFALFAKLGLVPIEVTPNARIGPMGYSYSFLAQKPR